MSEYRKKFGNSGEKQASEFFLNKDFTIVERNFRFGKKGEIDLIVFKDNLLIFVEVKKRSNENFGGPLYSITPKKKSTMRSVAKYFLLKNSSYDNKSITVRFDLIAIEDDEILWIDDIIR